MNFGLVAYLMWDFSNNFKQPGVIFCEVIVVACMITDISIYSLVHGIHFNLINFLEWATLANFLLCFLFMAVNGVQIESEEFEVYLMIARFCLQVIRLLIGFARVKEHNAKKQSAQNIEINIDTFNMNEEQVRYRGIEMFDI